MVFLKNLFNRGLLSRRSFSGRRSFSNSSQPNETEKGDLVGIALLLMGYGCFITAMCPCCIFECVNPNDDDDFGNHMKSEYESRNNKN